MCHRPEQVIIGQRKIWAIRRVGYEFSFERFQVGFNGLSSCHQSLGNNFEGETPWVLLDFTNQVFPALKSAFL